MADTQDEATAAPAVWPGWAIATAACIRFYSRLPVPLLPGEGDAHGVPDFRIVPRALPLAAFVIALPAGAVLLGAGLSGIAPLLAATLAVTVLTLTTGALHEDGLADTADGLFGGHTPERRLEIMKDSRLGSYGALALGLALLLRVTALASILESAGAWAAAGAVLAAAPWSRAEGIHLLAREAPARQSGTAAAVGVPTRMTALIGFGLSLALVLAIAWTTQMPPAAIALGLCLSLAAVALLRRTARRLIGGQTGDILGAAQQISEIAVYLGFALVLGWSGR